MANIVVVDEVIKLERLAGMLRREVDTPELHWDDKFTCSGLVYGYAQEGINEGIDVVTTVKEQMMDVCDGGLMCDQCKVYNVLAAFVSDVVIVEVPDDKYPNASLNMVGLNEEQLTVIFNALQTTVDVGWDNVRDFKDDMPGEEQVEVYKSIRVAEQLREVIKQYFS